GRGLAPRTVAALAAAHQNIAGLKDTVDSAAHIQETIALVKPQRPEFSVLAGMDYHLLNTLLSGGDGCVPGTANFAPEPFVRLYADARAGRLEAAAERHRTLAPFAWLFTVDAAHPAKARDVRLEAGMLTPDAAAVVADDRVDVVVEVMGGIEPARTLLLDAIRRGKSVVTANKQLLAQHGPELFTEAKRAGVDLRLEASVGGGLPVIQPLRESLAANRTQEGVGSIN